MFSVVMIILLLVLGNFPALGRRSMANDSSDDEGSFDVVARKASGLRASGLYYFLNDTLAPHLVSLGNFVVQSPTTATASGSAVYTDDARPRAPSSVSAPATRAATLDVEALFTTASGRATTLNHRANRLSQHFHVKRKTRRSAEYFILEARRSAPRFEDEIFRSDFDVVSSQSRTTSFPPVASEVYTVMDSVLSGTERRVHDGVVPLFGEIFGVVTRHVSVEKRFNRHSDTRLGYAHITEEHRSETSGAKQLSLKAHVFLTEQADFAKNVYFMLPMDEVWRCRVVMSRTSSVGAGEGTKRATTDVAFLSASAVPKPGATTAAPGSASKPTKEQCMFRLLSHYPGCTEAYDLNPPNHYDSKHEDCIFQALHAGVGPVLQHFREHVHAPYLAVKRQVSDVAVELADAHAASGSSLTMLSDVVRMKSVELVAVKKQLKALPVNENALPGADDLVAREQELSAAFRLLQEKRNESAAAHDELGVRLRDVETIRHNLQDGFRPELLGFVLSALSSSSADEESPVVVSDGGDGVDSGDDTYTETDALDEDEAATTSTLLTERYARLRAASQQEKLRAVRRKQQMDELFVLFGTLVFTEAFSDALGFSEETIRILAKLASLHTDAETCTESSPSSSSVGLDAQQRRVRAFLEEKVKPEDVRRALIAMERLDLLQGICDMERFFAETDGYKEEGVVVGNFDAQNKLAAFVTRTMDDSLPCEVRDVRLVRASFDALSWSMRADRAAANVREVSPWRNFTLSTGWWTPWAFGPKAWFGIPQNGPKADKKMNLNEAVLSECAAQLESKNKSARGATLLQVGDLFKFLKDFRGRISKRQLGRGIFRSGGDIGEQKMELLLELIEGELGAEIKSKIQHNVFPRGEDGDAMVDFGIGFERYWAQVRNKRTRFLDRARDLTEAFFHTGELLQTRRSRRTGEGGVRKCLVKIKNMEEQRR